MGLQASIHTHRSTKAPLFQDALRPTRCSAANDGACTMHQLVSDDENRAHAAHELPEAGAQAPTPVAAATRPLGKGRGAA
jgi:hypothetical protein